jgi:hypothetical protein
MLNIHKYRLRASSCPDIYRNSMTTIAKEHEQVTAEHNVRFLTTTTRGCSGTEDLGGRG